jgi:hypothetical protein
MTRQEVREPEKCRTFAAGQPCLSFDNGRCKNRTDAFFLKEPKLAEAYCPARAIEESYSIRINSLAKELSVRLNKGDTAEQLLGIVAMNNIHLNSTFRAVELFVSQNKDNQVAVELVKLWNQLWGVESMDSVVNPAETVP